MNYDMVYLRDSLVKMNDLYERISNPVIYARRISDSIVNLLLV